MAKNNLYAMEQNLRSIAKKYKTVKYSIGLNDGAKCILTRCYDYRRNSSI